MHHLSYKGERIMLGKNSFFYVAGIGFLTLAKIKNTLSGYSSPKRFKVAETERCIKYDMRVVDLWLKHLKEYALTENVLKGKNVLELGPGSDLGVGIYLLSKGCSTYNACDVNDLMKSTPDSFYEKFLEQLKNDGCSEFDINLLREQLSEAKKGNSSRLNYKVRNDFDLVAAFGRSNIDLVFSQAAFEHFEDINATVAQLSEVCKPGAIAVVEIDLKTHSRWIREKDPNNIYRYPTWLYNLFWFRGIPNRMRPFQYKQAFERAGWMDVSITPIDKESSNNAYSGMNKSFADDRNQMDCLSVILCARKPLVA